jgi:hypothetical protein
MATCAFAPATLSGIEPFLPIDMRGDLHLDAPSGRMVRLSSDGSKLRLDVPGWEEVSGIGPRSFFGRRRVIISAARRLAMHGVSLDIELQGRWFLSLGDEVKPSMLSRALGLGPVNLSVTALFYAWR